MADDRQQRGPQDRTRVNLSEDYEVQYWCKKFGVTEERLREAVHKVGDWTESVQKELNRAA
jgi:hypothetical protein